MIEIKPKYQVKKIRWLDASFYDAQTEEIIEPMEVTSVGFLIEDNDEYIVLAREIISENNFRGQICIPKSSII